ncbi:MAG: tryptophan--tRNA ligase [Candidatus Eremiobacteraeota bacterium]|nr:tryptophan--tRNA ligase [Candidatus Eremiobacteraeota bacterium]
MARILSGMRPTGKLHLGHLFGAIQNWAKLQEEYESFFMVADWHALSTRYMHPETIKQDIFEVIADYISGGIDPEKCTFYLQSHVPEIAQLHLLVSMITPVSWVERSPTYKDQVSALGQDVATYGFMGYPILMTCDIICVKGNFVPVGQDQLPHLELAREIVRRFNRLYGDVFPEPQPKLTKYALVPGIDGRKMSKSYNNSIYLSDDPNVIWKKIKKTTTDPQKIYKGDPGHPDICPIFYYQKLFNTEEKCNCIDQNCKSGALGCAADKKELYEKMMVFLKPIQEKRKELEDNPQIVYDLLERGGEKARAIVKETLKEVKHVMKLD